MCSCTDRYARVLCPTHGNRHLSRTEYLDQLERPEEVWVCPTCGQVAEFDDDYFWQTHGDD